MEWPIGLAFIVITKKNVQNTNKNWWIELKDPLGNVDFLVRLTTHDKWIGTFANQKDIRYRPLSQRTKIRCQASIPSVQVLNI